MAIVNDPRNWRYLDNPGVDYNDHSFVTSRELYYRTQMFAIKEAGRAIVAVPGKISKNVLRVTETPKYDIKLYQKIFEKIDILRSMIERMAELILSPDTYIRPPRSVIRANKKINDIPGLADNIEFVRQWIRYKKFRTWLKEAVVCALWAGNSYSEIVYEKEGEVDDPGRVKMAKGWKIHELKLINPAEMRPVRNAQGDVLGYVQYPFKGIGTYLSSRVAQAYIDTRAGGLFFKPEEILHIKISPEPGEAYGTSIIESLKDILAIVVGMREDIGMIVKNYAAPTILFRIGTELIPASKPTVQEFSDNISYQLEQSSNLVTSTMVDAQVINAGQKALNIQPYMQQMLNLLFGSFGLPEILVGQGNETTEATGKMQLQSVSNSVLVFHQLIKDSVELQLFPYLCLNKHYNELRPSELNKIPELDFGEIETSEDRRIRLENAFRFGMISRQEWRKFYGMTPEAEGDLTPEANLAFQKALIKYEAEMAKKYAPPQASATTGKTPGQTPAKPKPTTKKKTGNEKPGSTSQK